MTRATSTTLDMMLERRIEDYWNIEGNRDLSDSWTGFTRFTMLDENPLDDIQARLLVARDLERHVRSSATKTEANVGYRKTEA